LSVFGTRVNVAVDAQQRQDALEAARRQDNDALGRLLDSFRPYVGAIVRGLWDERLAGRLGESDLIQDALLEAHRSFGAFRGVTVAELVVWLRQVVVRAAGHTLRRLGGTAKRSPGRETAADLDRLAASPWSDPAERAQQGEEVQQLLDALDRLPADMRQAVLGRHVEGLSHGAIAARLGRSEGAARMLYLRALRRLRELWEGDA
jgi:RNA polymerase sigma-70 factor (ECF subfamily)